MKKPNEYVLVHWEDISTHDDGWVDLEDMQTKKDVDVFSVGWIAREDGTHLYIVMDWCDGEGNTIGKIPQAAIKHLKKVKLRGFPPKEKKDGKGDLPVGEVQGDPVGEHEGPPA